MADDVHAIILIAILIVNSIILIKYASPKKTSEKFGFVIRRFFLIFIFFAITAPILLGHPPPRGVASSQFWMIFLCISLITISVHNKKVFSISIGMLFCMNFLLCMHYDLLLESRNFIGTNYYSSWLEKRNRSILVGAREELSKAGESDKNDYPEGWLSDVMNIPEQKRRYLDFDLTASEQHDLWHSWFTGLYAFKEWEISLWYPGGKFQTSWPKVVYRIKGKKPNNGVEQTPSK